MPPAPGVLARGPWRPDQVAAHWRPEEFEPDARATAAADAAIAELRERGSPSHDGLSARLADFTEREDGLELELQPMRWSVRLGEDASHALASLCVTRSADGRWLAGRRAPWVASWAGRWALGAPSRWGSTPRTRWPGSWTRNGRLRPSGCRWKRSCGTPAGSCSSWAWPGCPPGRR